MMQLGNQMQNLKKVVRAMAWPMTSFVAKSRLRRKEARAREIMSRAESIIGRAIVLGKRGQFKVAPTSVAISATGNCNIKCIMCPCHDGMTGPKITVEEAGKLFRGLTEETVHYGTPRHLDMTAGEPTLNPNLGDLYESFSRLLKKWAIGVR